MIVWSIQGNGEEVLTRSWIFAGISKKHSLWAGILLSSLFFTVMHLGNDGISVLSVIDLFIYGIFAALLMIKTGNVWLISGFHAAWNCFQGNVFAFKVSGIDTGLAFINISTKGSSWLTGGDFGVEGSLVSIAIQLVLVIYLYHDLFIKGGLTLRDRFDLADANGNVAAEAL